jgi:LuxR family transcriptional regulator, maltose regulon positive regulatory protein
MATVFLESADAAGAADADASSAAVHPPALLATKLHAPAPRGDRVSRPRLLARLDSGAERALSLVSAPAGFGKSTLVSDWLRASGRPAGWLSLDSGDGELRRFLSYLAAALERPLPGAGRSLAAVLAAPVLPEPEALLTPLLNALWEREPCVLVLDDYHVIESPEVHAAFAFLVEHLPPHLHLVVTTRVDPPLPLARLRARGQLCELRAEDLRFTGEEAARFLRDSMGLDVSGAEVEALEQRTEGWIAGLQMAALSLRGRDDVSALIAGFTGSHRFVLDYLTEEVLDRQPADRLDFLLQTAPLRRLCGGLCDAVTRRSDSQEVLESLETANLFLIPLDETRGWYRYHHLFAGLLCGELERRTAPADLAALHARASDWFTAHGLPDEAFEHAAAAGDSERVALILEAHGDAAMFRGELTAVVRWLAALDEADYRRHPRLRVNRALAAYATFHYPEFAAAVADLAVAAAETGDPLLVATLDVTEALARSAEADYAATVEAAERCLARLPDGELLVRPLVLLLLGLGLARTGRTARAIAVLDEVARLSVAVGNLTYAALARANQAMVAALEGRLGEAEARGRQGLALFAPFGDAPLPGAGQAYDVLAEVALERGDLARALELSETATRLSRSGGVAGFEIRVLGTLCRIQLSRRDLAAARAVLDEIEELVRRTQTAFWDLAFEAMRARLDLLEAEEGARPDLLDRVARWAGERGLLAGWDNLSERLLPEIPHDHHFVTAACLLVALGREAEALELLAALRPLAEERRWLRSRIEVELLEALALWRLAGGRSGRVAEPPAEALAGVRRALDLAAPEGFVQVFANISPGIPALLAACEQACPETLASPFGLRLREVLGLGVATPEAASGVVPAAHLEPAAPSRRPLPPGVEPLSERELEVLRTVAEGLSNAEAGRRLFLSPFTVKKHLEHVYGKLGARNRTEAIARARGLGLF